MTRVLGRGLALCAALACAGCTYYAVPAPTAVPVTTTTSTPASFDRSFDAARGALRDQGVAISREDAAAGVIEGLLDNGTVRATLRRQSDGSVRVEFNAAGASDPALVDRITRSYQARMGR